MKLLHPDKLYTIRGLTLVIDTKGILTNELNIGYVTSYLALSSNALNLIAGFSLNSLVGMPLRIHLSLSCKIYAG